MDKFQALHNFWNSFSISAYDVNSVPENAVFPRLTYEVVTDSFDNEVAVTNSLWYNSTSWAAISQKAQQIADSIGMGGQIVQYDGGAVWIKRASPFIQRLPGEKDTIKRIVMNFSMEFISEN